MKRIILIWIVSLLSIQAFSQSISSVVEDFDRLGDIYTQKIEIEEDRRYILSQNGVNSEIYNVEDFILAVFPSNFMVKDMKIYKDQIYFCGTSLGVGFIAKTTISDLFYSNTFESSYIPYSQSLDKMVLDIDFSNGEINIACIGTDNSSESIFFHHRENTGSYEIYKSPNPDEIFDDIILKGQYIISVGRDPNNNPTFFLLRGYDINSLAIWERKFDNNTGWRYRNKLLATSVYNNSIAIVGEGEDDGTNLITITSIVDLNNIANGPHYTKSFGSYRYLGNQGEFALIKDIMYSTPDQRLLILEEYPYTFSPPPFPPALTDLISTVMVIDILPNLTNREAIYSYINGIDHKYNSLIEKSPYVFISAGINPSAGEVEMWEGDRANQGGYNCNIIEPYDLREEIVNIDILDPVDLIYSNRIEWQIDTNNTMNLERNIICN